MRYFIIGFKSSGKTTTGRELARKMNMKFIDLDDYIEQMTGRSVPEIFSTEGENEFRNLEWKALKDVIKEDNIIVSTGGGVPCHCDSMNLMEKHGNVIYLRLDNDTLVSRLEKAAIYRPILKNKTRDELYQYIEDLKDRCEHHYLRARYIVDGNNLNIEGLVNILNRQV
jgi:shikimate kinase